MKIYDATQYSNKPTNTWLSDIVVSGTCFVPNTDGVRMLDNSILFSLVASAVRRNCPLVLDFESINKDQLIAALMLARLYGGSNIKLGAYGFSPDATGPGASQALKNSWSAKTWYDNMRVTNYVVALCDMVMPSCYLGDANGDAATWQSTVNMALMAARLRWPTKPLIPFVWPYSKNTNPSTYASNDAFWNVMKTMSDLADGCVIWSNPGEVWDPKVDWLATAELFCDR